MSSSITNLSIKPEALKLARAVERKLSKQEREVIYSYAWYNGREKGIALVVRASINFPEVVIVLNERRNSDDLVVDTYVQENRMDIPSWKDPGYDQAYEERQSFGYGKHEIAATHIYNVIRDAIKRQKAVMREIRARNKSALTKIRKGI